MKIEIESEELKKIINDAVDKAISSFKTRKPTSNPKGDLSFTKVLYASINGVKIEKPKWDTILHHMLSLAGKNKRIKSQLAEIFELNVVMGSKTNEGYKPIESIGISYQGTNANSARNAIVQAATELGYVVDIVYQWRDHHKASHPKEKGSIRVNLTD